MRLLILGATGLVGRHALALALADARVERVTAPGRRAPPAHDKLHAPTVDFERLPDEAGLWSADACLCALGTTLKGAGSREAFRRIDHGYALAAARLARRHGTSTLALVSAMTADPGSRLLYNRVKGELERDVEALGFSSLTLVRPGLIGGDRAESRPAERAAGLLLTALRPVLPRSLRVNPAPTIARALLDAALAGRPGRHVVGSAAMA